MSAAGGHLAQSTRAFLESLGSSDIQPFLSQWPICSERRSVPPVALPVLRWLSELEGCAVAGTRALVGEIRRAAGSLAWRQSYDAREVGTLFLAHYGWAEIVGLTGELPSEHIACGFLLLGPRTHYPPHAHEAEEIYVPLSGTATWQKGAERWLERSPGSIVHHSRHEPHSMRTGDEPLLALYLWRSDRLAQPSRLVTPPGEISPDTTDV